MHSGESVVCPLPEMSRSWKTKKDQIVERETRDTDANEMCALALGLGLEQFASSPIKGISQIPVNIWMRSVSQVTELSSCLF